MTALNALRNGKTNTVVLGTHEKIIQSILDFDFLVHRETPSVQAILTTGRAAQKFFFGSTEVLIPCFTNLADIKARAPAPDWMLNVQSGRRALSATVDFFNTFPAALGGVLFAENVTEIDARTLGSQYGAKKLLLGPASVGLLVPGYLKLGAISGTDPRQLARSHVSTPGSVAVIATSGGMTNECIRAVVHAGHRVSFALAVGGERFPTASLTTVFELAEADQTTDTVVYFGELGGVDEYELVSLIQQKRFTKKVIAYIAGSSDEVFPTRMQFGHAKALALTPDESARAKRSALRLIGVTAPDTYSEFLRTLNALPKTDIHDTVIETDILMDRQKSILSTRVVHDTSQVQEFVRGNTVVHGSTFAKGILSALLDRDISSPITVSFAEAVFELLIDHGGNVSGAVNTMITARAGRDMATSLAAGLLTIGPRFGGALNAAAETLHSGVVTHKSAMDIVDAMNALHKPIPGIGHKKYRVGVSDPRVESLAAFATLLTKHPHYDLALQIEKITTAKNGSLILNIDGAVAALFLDILSECEHVTDDVLAMLIQAELFNAFFIIPRSVGFIAHYMEQKVNDEGLFRLPDELLYVKDTKSKSKPTETA